jgi:hypothetical protein
MHKNQYVTYTTLSAIAVSAILLTSYTVGGMLFSQRAIAQTNATSAAPSNATSAAPSNATSAAPSNATAPVGQSFVWQGTKSSVADPLAKHGKEQVAWILIPRPDDAVYSGVLTYTASKGANPEVWHLFSPGNSTAFSKTFGTVSASPYSGKSFAVADLSSGASGSIPFSGNALLLHAKSPFTVTYTVNAVAQPAKTFNDIKSMTTAAAAAAAKTNSSKTSSSSSGTSSKTSSSSSGTSSKTSSKSK